MKAMLSSGRVEPVVRPPSRGTNRTRLPDLEETTQAERGDLQSHSIEEATRSGFALKQRTGSRTGREACIRALTKRSVSNARINPPPDASDNTNETKER
jgi:hypothetical protein